MSMDLPNLPQGLSARPFTDQPDDWSDVSEVWHASSRSYGREVASTPAALRVSWLNQANFDPLRDVVLVHAGDELVAFASNRWMDVADKGRAYRHLCTVHPDWRGRGIGSSLLSWARAELLAKADLHALSDTHFQTSGPSEATDATDLLRRNGYRQTEYFAEMLRTNLEGIPDLPVPDGADVRPVEEAHLRLIYEAEVEAFRDHWGFVEPSEGDWVRFLEDPHRDESMWKVAWEGDAVVGMVRSFISREENEAYGRRRGYTENISTRRDWRGKGMAAALIARSLVELKDRGMTEAGLAVHTDNLTGALGLYEKMGFVVTHQDVVWEAPLDR